MEAIAREAGQVAEANGADGASGPPRWARWITIVSLIGALGALVWTVYSVGPSALLERLLLLGPWLGVVVAVEVLVTLCDAAALYHLGGSGEGQQRYRHVLMAQVAGRAVNVVTPFGGLGELVKIALLVERIKQARAVAAVLLYNIASQEMSAILIAVGAPLTALLVELGDGPRATLLVAGAVCAAIAVALPLLVHRGMLASVVGLARRLRLVREHHLQRWHKKLASVDDRLRDGTPERRRARYLGFGFMLLSRGLNWAITGLLVHAAGGPTGVGFLAAVFTAGQVIAWFSGAVPLGLGIAEGGNYAVFRALGADPAIGVTVALGRRVIHILYAFLGIILVSVNETVQRVRGKQGTVLPS